MPDGRRGTNVRTVGADAIKLASVVRSKYLGRNLRRLLRDGRLAAGNHLAHGRLTFLEVGRTLVADHDQLDIDFLCPELCNARLRLLDRSRVVRAAEATVARNHNEADLLRGAALEERDVEGLRLQALQKATENPLQSL